MYSKHNGFMVWFIIGLISPRCFEIFVFPQIGGPNPNSLNYWALWEAGTKPIADI